MASTDDIIKILSDMRKAIEKGCFEPIERRKNMHTLTMLGIGWNEVKREIYELTPSDYLQGPEIDRDYPETEPFWMFKKMLMDILFMLNLKCYMIAMVE